MRSLIPLRNRRQFRESRVASSCTAISSRTAAEIQRKFLRSLCDRNDAVGARSERALPMQAPARKKKNEKDVGAVQVVEMVSTLANCGKVVPKRI